ncbi:unnamed protein product [Heterobilharzia americana]|nr:unnamed protein product [Heterobilharzia americana]
MQFDADNGYPSRPHSVAGRCSDNEVDYKSRSPSVNSDFNCYTSHCSPEIYIEPHSFIIKAETLKTYSRNGLRPGHIHQSSNINSNGSRQTLARWNAVRKHNNNHYSNLCVDAQRAKCLRRGPLINHGFQRRQVRLGNGGHIPCQRS